MPGEPVRLDGQPAATTGSWPWFRGAGRDAIGHEDVPLARSWPAAGPPVLWQVEMGEGYAGPAIVDGCVYVLDYDCRPSADTLRCLSLDDGRDIWRNSYPIEVARNHGMSRTVPAIVGPYVVTLGPLPRRLLGQRDGRMQLAHRPRASNTGSPCRSGTPASARWSTATA